MMSPWSPDARSGSRPWSWGCRPPSVPPIETGAAGQRKYVLTTAGRARVPREVIYRAKLGFSLPIDNWFLGPWAPVARETILGKTARERGLSITAYIEQLWGRTSGVPWHGTARFWLQLHVLSCWLP